MLVSHESPISILDKSRMYNDYDYALVHLFETHPDYYNFFKDSVTVGREVLLDNSIFELGESFDSDKFAKYANELKPTYYIVPDVLEDGYKTIQGFDNFINKYPDLPGLKIGVVQGKTWDELVDCYKYMSDNADYIAISFDYSYYIVTGVGKTKLERYSTGRYKFINDLQREGIWNKHKPHHLLGCSLAKEFNLYVNDRSIRSVDTSNPVVAGIKELRYNGNLGLNDKPSIKLADLIDHEVTDTQMENIEYNVKNFRKIVNGS
tara:strand:+ start:5901 stop:6689 length:789 start_codon:yes stop_codon:yes gene_type:complete